MKIESVQWREGFPHRGVKATEAHKLIEKLPEKTPVAVVEASRPKKSAIHKLVEWDDDVAATQYRLQQGRDILSSIHVRYETEAPTDPVPAYVVIKRAEVKGSGESVYENTHTALQQPIYRDNVICQALRDLLAWKRRYSAINELAEYIPVIEKQIRAIQKKVESLADA